MPAPTIPADPERDLRTAERAVAALALAAQELGALASIYASVDPNAAERVSDALTYARQVRDDLRASATYHGVPADRIVEAYDDARTLSA